MKSALLFEGKEKEIYSTADKGVVRIHYKDIVTAFNNIKRANFPGKGVINCEISSLLFSFLNKQGINTHYLRNEGEDMFCREIDLIPLEFTVRNVIAGRAALLLDLPEGTRPSNVIYEIRYNNDELDDPMINEHHAVALGLVNYDELKKISEISQKVNELLTGLFDSVGITLVDLKLEFGRIGDQIVLSDEISPDTCRLWDKVTGKKLDKDRFRHDLGYICDAYRDVLQRVKSINGLLL